MPPFLKGKDDQQKRRAEDLRQQSHYRYPSDSGDAEFSVEHHGRTGEVDHVRDDHYDRRHDRASVIPEMSGEYRSDELEDT